SSGHIILRRARSLSKRSPLSTSSQARREAHRQVSRRGCPMGQPGLPPNRDPRPVPRTPTYRHTAGVIHEVDSALRTLIEREADGTRDVEIVCDAPTREWAGRRNSPTIDVYLYDIREDMR